MLKNKWLAIGLSVLAVLLIVYRVFFDTATPTAPPRSTAPLMASPDLPEDTAETTPVLPEWGAAGGELILDLDSPLLLKRVTPSSESDMPYVPLDGQFGMGIFIRPGAPPGETAEAVEAPKVESFELNGIVIDRARRLAIINRQLVGEGDFVGGARVVRIVPGRVICQLDGAEMILEAVLPELIQHKDGG
jgi:hypothetical protein